MRNNELMVKSNDKVENFEPIAEADGSRINAVDLRERGIDELQAADLRRRLATFAEDWERPEMSDYDELPPR